MDSVILIAIAAVSGFLKDIPWTTIFLLTRFIGIRLYIITRHDECVRVQKRVGTFTSEIGDGERGQGYSIGRWYFLHITAKVSTNIWMIATTASYKALTSEMYDDDIPMKTEEGEGEKSALIETKPKKRMTVCNRSGSFESPWYRTRKIQLLVTPRLDQQGVIDKIKEHHKKTHHTVAYIWGKPGTGKSMIALFLAQEMDGTYCNTMLPWHPNDSLSYIYSEFEPTEERPLIIVFEEFDSAIVKIHAGIEQHRSLPTEVLNKAGWNRLFDDIQRGMYPNVIVILTSNQSPSFFDSLDTSYIREGRVDLTFEF